MYREFADQPLAAFVGQPSPAFAALDVAAMREGIAERARQRPRGPEMHEVGDRRLGDLRLRLYRPAAQTPSLIVYLHGAGWTIGNLESHDRVCRRLAAGSGAAVLALDYRLAPEHPWPASVDDTIATLCWVASAPADLGPAPSTVAVVGDSAGGTLAALACLRLRDESPSALPALQVLLYANTDLAGTQPSMREKASGWGLNAAEHDPLRDESEAYAERLRDAGVEVQLRREPGLIHNFMMLDEISPACAAAADRVAADVWAALERA